MRSSFLEKPSVIFYHSLKQYFCQAHHSHHFRAFLNRKTRKNESCIDLLNKMFPRLTMLIHCLASILWLLCISFSYLYSLFLSVSCIIKQLLLNYNCFASVFSRASYSVTFCCPLHTTQYNSMDITIILLLYHKCVVQCFPNNFIFINGWKRIQHTMRHKHSQNAQI